MCIYYLYFWKLNLSLHFEKNGIYKSYNLNKLKKTGKSMSCKAESQKTKFVSWCVSKCKGQVKFKDRNMKVMEV